MAKVECSNRLRVVLAEKEMTNRWLAEQMGVTDMTVSRWKINKIQPSMMQFVEIACLLKIDIEDLIEADFNYEVWNNANMNILVKNSKFFRSEIGIMTTWNIETHEIVFYIHGQKEHLFID